MDEGNENKDLAPEQPSTENAPANSNASETTQPSVEITTTETTPANNDTTSDDRLFAALTWVSMFLLQIPVVSIVLLLIEGNKDRPLQRHHALQSIGFWVAAVVYEFVAGVVFTVGTLVTLGCGAVVLWILFFVPHILAIYYAWQAYQGREVKIPLVTDVMKQQKWL